MEALERRCPNHVELERWQRAVEDGRRFLAHWGGEAQALGWSSRKPSYGSSSTEAGNAAVQEDGA